MGTEVEKSANDFIRQIIQEEVKAGKNGGQVVTRFPPEPNGYLHIGHAKSICLNFGIAEEYTNAICRLRFDDTNPCKESQEYIDAIIKDVKWLGYSLQPGIKYTSDYFDRLHACALQLIDQGKAYVCSLSPEEIRHYRGTLTEPGRNSPYRDRSIAENRDLFLRMTAGEFADGLHTLRGRIDMASPNMNMRDPTFYRIRRFSHHQTGDRWCVYPTYDYSHPLSDAFEGVTHSLCTLEFEDHRPLYDWILQQFNFPVPPRQIEFSRLSIEYTVLSKRKLNTLVAEGYVSGWDDPRMPTIAGMRRRGYTAQAIRSFCQKIGISKADNRVEMALLENCVREDLDRQAPRAMGVLRPLKIILENYPKDQVEMLDAAVHPKDESMGTRKIALTREIYIDRQDFQQTASKDFKRLVMGGEVRLRNAYVIQCHDALRDPDTGEVVALRCSYDAKTLGVDPPGRKIKGVIHWVSVTHSLEVEVRLYDRLFSKPDPDNESDGLDFTTHIHPDSCLVLTGCRVEQNLARAQAGDFFQFEREGFFCVDSHRSQQGRLVFNRTVTLRDTWARSQK